MTIEVLAGTTLKAIKALAGTTVTITEIVDAAIDVAINFATVVIIATEVATAQTTEENAALSNVSK